MLPRAITSFLLLAVTLPTLTAQTLIFPNFTDRTGLQLNDAVVTGSSISLASSHSDRRGSFFTTTQYDVSDFSAVFAFRISSPGGISDGIAAGADGLTFTLQRVGDTALGAFGSGLGYEGITSSVAVEFDTFKNGSATIAPRDPNSNHIGINTNGIMTSLPLGTVNIANAFDDGSIWTVWVDYNGSVLEVRASNNNAIRPSAATLAYTINIPTTIGGSTAFVGFTAATGSAYGNHEILGFAFSDTFLANGIATVPEPSTYALLGLGLGIVFLQVWRRRRQ
jgi:hypothetical protein